MMNKRELIVLCLLAAGGVMQAQQWPDTPVEARPGARWWWLGSAVDEKPFSTPSSEVFSMRMPPVCAWLTKPFPASFSTTTVLPSSLMEKL